MLGEAFVQQDDKIGHGASPGQARARQTEERVQVASCANPDCLGVSVVQDLSDAFKRGPTAEHSSAVHVLRVTNYIRKVPLWLGHASATEVYPWAFPDERHSIQGANTAPDLEQEPFDDVEDVLQPLLDSIRSRPM